MIGRGTGRIVSLSPLFLFIMGICVGGNLKHMSPLSLLGYTGSSISVNSTSHSAASNASSRLFLIPEMKQADGMEFDHDRDQQAGAFPPLEMDENSRDPRPTKLRLVMIGDSLTRYQYLSLAYFLRTSTWYNSSSEGPDIFSHRGMETSTWSALHNYTTQLMRPNERCDCHRPPRMVSKTRRHLAKHIENRYFMDDGRDNMLVYLQAYGHMSPIHGRVPAVIAMQNISAFHFEHEPTKSTWWYDDWEHCVTDYVAKLEPKPTHVIFNAGIWNHNFSIPGVGRKIAQALNESGIIGIWKTTTYQAGGIPLANESDALMSELFHPRVLDSSWTSKVKPQLYWDTFHFLEPVYRAQNEDMLELVGHTFPPLYEKVNKAELL